MIEEMQQDLPPIERTGTVQDLISEDKIAQGATALTVEGRPYHKAAQELETMVKRRIDVLNEYTILAKSTHASLTELTRVHARIDQIINELSRS